MSPHVSYRDLPLRGGKKPGGTERGTERGCCWKEIGWEEEIETERKSNKKPSYTHGAGRGRVRKTLGRLFSSKRERGEGKVGHRQSWSNFSLLSFLCGGRLKEKKSGGQKLHSSKTFCIFICIAPQVFFSAPSLHFKGLMWSQLCGLNGGWR